MQKFLVGGAVRDKLLGREVKDRDWVVVGSSPEEMLRLGFSQVGADFPVFLHPESGEEYALARRERKSGKGYHGFEVEFDSSVSLEEDLGRRDLSINAMAEDEDGNIFDPFGGMDDLVNKRLRPVSDAFKEDPVRVLRAVRFLARFGPEWSLDRSVKMFAADMIENGDFKAVPRERFLLEFEKALSEDHWQLFVGHPLIEEVMLHALGDFLDGVSDLDEGHWLVQLADQGAARFFEKLGASNQMLFDLRVAEAVHQGDMKSLLALARRKLWAAQRVVSLSDPDLADRLGLAMMASFMDFHEEGQDPRESRLAMEAAQLEMLQ